MVEMTEPGRQPINARGKHLDDGGPFGVHQGFVQRVDEQVAPISGGLWDTVERREDGGSGRGGGAFGIC
jgi:hypothetical protein